MNNRHTISQQKEEYTHRGIDAQPQLVNHIENLPRFKNEANKRMSIETNSVKRLYDYNNLWLKSLSNAVLIYLIYVLVKKWVILFKMLKSIFELTYRTPITVNQIHVSHKYGLRNQNTQQWRQNWNWYTWKARNKAIINHTVHTHDSTQCPVKQKFKFHKYPNII